MIMVAKITPFSTETVYGISHMFCLAYRVDASADSEQCRNVTIRRTQWRHLANRNKYLSDVGIDRLQRCLNNEHRIGSQVRLEFRVVDVLGFLYFPAVLAIPNSSL